MATAARRQQIIDTARIVFAARGFRGATTREIAAAANVTEAVIFQHFPDKSALYCAILEQKATEPATDRWFAALEAARAGGDDAETLRVLYAGLIQQHRDDPEYLRLTVFASLEEHPAAPRLHARGRRVYEFLESFVIERQEAGRFRPAPPAALVRAVLALPIYYVLQREIFKTPWPAVDPDTLIAEGVRFTLAGLSATCQKAES